MSTSIELAGQLFLAPDRLGWEYCEPLAPQPFAERAPVWVEPPPPDIAALERKKALGVRKLLGRSLWSLVIVLVCFAGGPALVLVGLCSTFAWTLGFPILIPNMKINQIKEQHQADREQRHAQFQMAHNQWKRRVAAHDQEERERYDSTNLWFPLHLLHAPGRVDVFGGTGHGWASLVATLGSSLLAGGTSMVVLDLSEQRVARELVGLGREREIPVTAIDLPGDAPQLDLIAGLDADAQAEFLAEAVQVVRRSADGVDQRAFDVELLLAVTGRLEGPATFARIGAGLRVLRRIYDVDNDTSLSAAEIRALTAHVDVVGATDRVHNELQFLTSTLEMLAKDASPDPATDPVAVAQLVEAPGLQVVRTASSQRRHKEIVDSVLFHRVLEDLRGRTRLDGKRVMVVAGADRLGLDSLEDLTTQARRLGLRLALLFEHLRGDLKDLVGGADSTTVFMRLGNFQEADAAAQQIGRGQKFVLSQLTKQIGETLTTGTSDSFGLQEGVTVTSTSGGGYGDGHSNRNWSNADTETRTESWQTTTSQSRGRTETEGVTLARVHEFMVEPTQIQDLPHTAFLLVSSGGSARRIMLGDCNPGICLLPRVSTIAAPEVLALAPAAG